jgi:hypothetical protein
MANKKARSFALCKDSFLAKAIPDSAENMHTQRGMMVEIVEANPDKTCTIRIKDYYSDGSQLWDECLFTCSSSHLVKVSENIWPFLIAVVDPEDRYRFITQRSSDAKKIALLNDGDCVKVSGKPFGLNCSYDCIIRYVGLVPELGPGFYFGLELLVILHIYNIMNNYYPYYIERNCSA